MKFTSIQKKEKNNAMQALGKHNNNTAKMPPAL